MSRLPSISPLFPYTTLFRSLHFAPDFLDDMIRGKGRGKRLVSRQNDLHPGEAAEGESQCGGAAPAALRCGSDSRRGQRDRKSTRLNSSHTVISYAVFCLKKK